MSRPLYAIVADIRANWPKVHYSARPYLDALTEAVSIHDTYIIGDHRSTVLGLLANMSTFRGPEARRLKDELQSLL